MAWTEEERKEIIKTLEEEAIKYRRERKMLRYLEAKARIKAWSTPNLCRDYTQECQHQLSLASCIIRHYPDEKDRKKYCPNIRSVVWNEEEETSLDERYS